MKSFTVALFASLVFLCVGCGDSKGPSEPHASTAASAVPESFYLASVDGTPRSVKDVVANAKDGEQVLLTGRAGGNADVFVPGRAAFLIADLSLKDCYDMTDECKQPWDYCCEDPEALKTGTIAVELRNGERVLSSDVRGFHGLDHGHAVTIRGVVKRSAAGSIVLVAETLNVGPGPGN